MRFEICGNYSNGNGIYTFFNFNVNDLSYLICFKDEFRLYNFILYDFLLNGKMNNCIVNSTVVTEERNCLFLDMDLPTTIKSLNSLKRKKFISFKKRKKSLSLGRNIWDVKLI